MNKKGFVLMETIVVIVVISVALLTIFASYSKILTKVKTENKYDTSEYIYMTKYVRDYLKDTFNIINVTSIDIFPCSLNAEGKINECSSLPEIKNYYNYIKGKTNTIDIFNVKGVYILSDINNFNTLIDQNGNGEKESGDYNNAELFNANMIDYIRKLDVGDNDTILVVEFDRTALDNQGNPIYTTSCPKDGKDSEDNDCLPLTETYIASLEW